MDIGRAIAIALKRQNVTAAEISRRTGLSAAVFSKYKAGTATPSLDALIRLAAAMGVRVSELIALAETCGKEGAANAPEMHEDRGAYRMPDGVEKRLLAALGTMSDAQRAALLAFIETMVENDSAQ